MFLEIPLPPHSLANAPLACNGETIVRNPCAVGGPIIPPVGRAASGFDDAEVGCACEDVSSSVPVPVACKRV